MPCLHDLLFVKMMPEKVATSPAIPPTIFTSFPTLLTMPSISNSPGQSRNEPEIINAGFENESQARTFEEKWGGKVYVETETFE